MLSAEEYRAVFEASPDGIMVVDEKGIVRDLNPHLIRGVTPPGELYGVRVPVGGTPQVMAYMAQGLTAAAAD